MGLPTFIGKVFDNAEAFRRYLDELTWRTWKPRYVVMHHTGMPDLKVWGGWQTRKPPISDKQWLSNLSNYYANEMRWSAGPHFFVTPTHIMVLSDPVRIGVHAVEFNSTSWGIECVGNFDTEQFLGPIRDMSIGALAAINLAMGWTPSPFVKRQRGLHFHRDDSTTSKTCPGKRVLKPEVSELIMARMHAMELGDGGGGAHEVEVVRPSAAPRVWNGVVAGLTSGDALNVRAEASARSPVVRTLSNGSRVTVLREAMNGATKWLEIATGEWATSQYINKVAG